MLYAAWIRIAASDHSQARDRQMCHVYTLHHVTRGKPQQLVSHMPRVTACEDRACRPHLHGVGRRRRDAQLVRDDDDIMITSCMGRRRRDAQLVLLLSLLLLL